MSLFFVSLDLVSMLMLFVTLPGSLYLLFITLSALRKSKASKAEHNQQQSHNTLESLAIIIPAHNESTGILRTLNNLKYLASKDGHTDIIVVADNCDDDTADIATKAGVRVLTRQNPELRGKGYALDYAFHALESENYAGYIVVDADTEAQDNFLTVIRQHFAAGAQVIQTRYGVLNSHESLRTQILEIALAAFNVLRPLGRHQANLSAGILGNGFALRKNVLAQVPYTATSVVEDVEYHLHLISAGYQVEFANETQVYGEMPSTEQQSRTQRSRWEGGRLRMLVDFGGSLAKLCFKGNFRFAEPLFDLLLLPLAYHVLLLLLPLPLVLITGSELLLVASFVSLLIVVMHVMAAIHVAGLGWDRLLVLCRVPFYLLWKIRMIGRTVRTARKDSDWVRTERKG